MVEPGQVRNGKLSHQLLFWFVLIALIPLGIVTLLVYQHSVRTIEELVTYNLNAVGKRQALRVQTYLEERERDVTNLARNPVVLVAASAGPGRALEDFLDYFRESAGYRDLILADRTGRILYSSQHRLKAVSLTAGPPSIASRAFNQSTSLLTTESSTFGPHPDTGEPTLFLAAPLLTDQGLEGAVLLEMAPEPIYQTVNDFTGLGDTGETMLITRVEGQLRYLTPTRHAPEAAGRAVEGDPRSLAFLESGVEGARAQAATSDYRGRQVLAVLRYLPQLEAAVVTKIDEQEALRPVASLRTLAWIALAATLVLVVLAAGTSARAITEPIDKLIAGTETVARVDLGHRIEVRADNEVGRLADAFNEMTGRLRESIEQLKETTETKERIESELQIAHDIQLSILPKIFPAFMHKAEFDAFATVVPAKEVGGDLYDFFLIDDDRLLFLIGDVSGKGVPAALFMAVTKTLFKATALGGAPLGQLMVKVNQELCLDNDSGMFVTIFCAILNYQTGRLEYANAGHNPPYLLGQQGLTALPRVSGMGMGVFEEADYQVGSLDLVEGDTLFLYTDGLTEAENVAQQFYGDDRLKQFLVGQVSGSPRTVVNQALEEVRNFSQGAAQSDDITMLVVSYYGTKGGGGGKSNELSVTLRSDLEELTRLAEAIEAFGEYNSMPSKLLYQLNLALEELVSNVINYQSCRLIQVDVSFEGGNLRVRLQDDGEEFNPFEEAPVPDLDLDLEEREIGGLGVHLVKTMFAEHDYRRRGGRNFITLMRNDPNGE
ncbi:MAG: SpoIIE family protein phosphatase [Vulcanimicrobiota bacterium]